MNTKTPEQMIFFVTCVQRAQREILDDIKNGPVPYTVEGFGELHDFVDANEYGGLCEDEVVNAGNALWPMRTDADTFSTQEFMDICDEIQTHVDKWIHTQGFKDLAFDAHQEH